MTKSSWISPIAFIVSIACAAYVGFYATGWVLLASIGWYTCGFIMGWRIWRTPVRTNHD
jgi:hypothetical protein